MFQRPIPPNTRRELHRVLTNSVHRTIRPGNGTYSASIGTRDGSGIRTNEIPPSSLILHARNPHNSFLSHTTLLPATVVCVLLATRPTTACTTAAAMATVGGGGVGRGGIPSRMLRSRLGTAWHGTATS